MKRTKIIATYGPATASPTKISKLVEAGVNIFRINCSHGRTEDFVKATNIIRKGTEKSRYPVALLFDISG
ncbi:MAG: pyruvate kinase, partial [Candidatus Zixiibacteriota bacterium]